jgi:hypothetical protein
MSDHIKAILEYDAARLEIKKLKAPLYDLLGGCDFEEYSGKNNCIKLMRAYHVWENNDVDYDEPEYRAPCESCQKALEIFKQLAPAKKRFGIAKTRLSRIARDYRNSDFIYLPESI